MALSLVVSKKCFWNIIHLDKSKLARYPPGRTYLLDNYHAGYCRDQTARQNSPQSAGEKSRGII